MKKQRAYIIEGQAITNVNTTAGDEFNIELKLKKGAKNKCINIVGPGACLIRQIKIENNEKTQKYRFSLPIEMNVTHCNFSITVEDTDILDCIYYISKQKKAVKTRSKQTILPFGAISS